MSQKLEVLRHLAQGKRLTTLSAWRLVGCLSLSQRIGELKREKWKIETRMVKLGRSRVAEYSINTRKRT